MRTWIGIGILVVLLLTGIFVTLYTADVQDRNARLLSESRDAAAVGQWEKAAGKYFQARELWEKNRKALASVVDHEPMEEADSLFSQLEVYLKARDPVAYCSCCASLEVFARAIGESHSVSWWSLL